MLSLFIFRYDIYETRKSLLLKWWEPRILGYYLTWMIFAFIYALHTKRKVESRTAWYSCPHIPSLGFFLTRHMSFQRSCFLVVNTHTHTHTHTFIALLLYNHLYSFPLCDMLPLNDSFWVALFVCFSLKKLPHQITRGIEWRSDEMMIKHCTRGF